MLVVGDVNPDIVVHCQEPPLFGQVEQLVDGIEVVLGGSAAIVACGVARLGLETTLVAAVGDDAWGDWCTGQLATRGVIVSALRMVATATGATVLLLRNGGTDRAILTSLGAIEQLTGAEVSDELLAGHDHLHIGGVFLMAGLSSGLVEMCGRARRAGLRISLDPNYDPSGRWALDDKLLAEVDVLLVNASEAQALAACADTDKAGRLLAERCPTVVVKDGQRGALLAQSDQLTRISSAQIDVVDSVGAGDNLAAGVISALARGWPVVEAAMLGVACGTASLRATGGTAAQPTLEEAKTFLEAITVVAPQ